MSYLSLNYGVFAPKGSPVRGPSDILDKRIAVGRDDIGHAYLLDNGIGAALAVVAAALTVAALAILWAMATLASKKQATAALSLESRRNAEAQDRLQAALTESEAARLEAREAVRDKMSFITSVSHDLRAPLYGMLGATELLSGSRLDDEQAATPAMARTAAEQLDRVFSGLLEAVGGQARIAVSGPERVDATAATAVHPATDAPGHGRCGRAIVAEDEAINRLYLRRVLEAAGIEVRQAMDGKAALDAASDGPWSFILMDVSMPGMDGLEATRLIRTLEAERGATHIPIIALTAHSSAADREACTQAGMDGFLSKPFSEQALWIEVDKTIATVSGALFR